MTLKTLWIFTKKYAAKPYSFLVTDATLASDNLFTFQKNFCLEKIYKLTMIFHDNIGDEKVQYDINREEAKTSALLSGKIYKYKYLVGEEILSSDQRKVIEQAQFTYSPLRKLEENKQKQLKIKRKPTKSKWRSWKTILWI